MEPIDEEELTPKRQQFDKKAKKNGSSLCTLI